jgi:hypothetical protein
MDGLTDELERAARSAVDRLREAVSASEPPAEGGEPGEGDEPAEGEEPQGPVPSDGPEDAPGEVHGG